MRGVANRFVHSRAYILLYLIMAALSVTTVVLSLTDGCPGPAFYILEVIINTSMILEVSIRLVALGRVSIPFYPPVPAVLTEEARTTAILAISVQRGRLNSDRLLRVDVACAGIRKMRCWKQRGRDIRHSSLDCTERSSIWKVGVCDETVRTFVLSALSFPYCLLATR